LKASGAAEWREPPVALQLAQLYRARFERTLEQRERRGVLAE
jgi:hypothetical protein